ncbi:hypothetical protein EDI_106580 [Entamoeba dispar SAW760]|uniref:Uncharacterized protein n=1 Tax=Entamoeba dispar (strain ATCC PRA-260 / SAW760) TaxID=370354 RepID=B0ET36_ENTDS|nr:uncharacterized protein EDI_106580 [Entamoeba dispar SAW760]EDR22289.1 hypothetical protein EDI_106580 [Entamoeba dispar SAW760]|eukprot:EDR22289.1 hypothetical protein EDI_106580 [Entamoeba dispar SAW760]
MKYVFILLVIATLSKAKVLSNSPCFPNYHIENLKNVQDKNGLGLLSPDMKIVHDCYQDVPNQEMNVMGNSSHTKCYVSTKMFFELFHNKKIPRCGQCLELHSVSLKTTHCIISGSFEITNPINKYIKYTDKTIVVDPALFMMLSGFYKETATDVLPASIKFVDCLYKTYPAAVLTKVDNNITELVLFNTNVIVESLLFKQSYYYADTTTTKFTLSTPTKNGQIDTDKVYQIKLFNFIGTSIFINIKFIPNIIFISSTPFPITYNESTSLCSFNPQTNIILKDGSMGDVSEDIADDDFFSWEIGYQPTGDPLPHIPLKKDDPSFIFENDTVGYSIKYPVPIRISEHYHYVTLITESDNPINLTYPKIYSSHGYDLNNLESFSCGSLAFKYSITKQPTNRYRLEFRINLILSKCHGFSNFYILRFKTIVGTKMTIVENYWTNRNALNYTVCNNSFECEIGDECDPTESNLKPLSDQVPKNYTKGCAPFCGVCAFGYSCNQAAKCVKNSVHNTRSGCLSIVIGLSTILLMLI